MEQKPEVKGLLVTSRRLGVLVLCFLLVVLPAATASAHEEAARTEQLNAGPYQLSVELSDNPAHVEQPLQITISSLPGGPSLDGATVTVTGVPGPGTDATQTRKSTLQPEPSASDLFAGEVSLPVRGAWNLRVQVSGSAGEGTANVPLTVATPSAIPVWLGWLIGLSPLIGVGWFAWWNRRYLLRLRRTETTPLG